MRFRLRACPVNARPILAADNATYVIAQAAVSGSTVSLTPYNASVPGPFTGVRYAWQGFPLCVLSNAQGMPTGPFVTNM